MKENLYIKSHRYSNPEYRDEYERIFEGRNKIIIFDDTEDAWSGVAKQMSNKLDELSSDIQTEMEKGKVTGHFV